MHTTTQERSCDIFFFLLLFSSLLFFFVCRFHIHTYITHISENVLSTPSLNKKKNVAQLTCLNRAVIRSNYTLYTQRTHRRARSTCAKSSLFHHQFFSRSFHPIVTSTSLICSNNRPKQIQKKNYKKKRIYGT